MHFSQCSKGHPAKCQRRARSARRLAFSCVSLSASSSAPRKSEAATAEVTRPVTAATRTCRSPFEQDPWSHRSQQVRRHGDGSSTRRRSFRAGLASRFASAWGLAFRVYFPGPFTPPSRSINLKKPRMIKTKIPIATISMAALSVSRRRSRLRSVGKSE